MGFRINTNVGAMNAHRNATQNNVALDKSLERLSSGLRINTAADDASGLAIANQLKSQASGLGQSIRNANDGIGVAQTADGALDEYENIINTVRTKSIQAASDGQNADSRKAIQSDIDKLMQEANNIAKTTSFNGQKLLDGSFQNKAFHIGAYSNETVGINISNTQTNTIGRHVDTTGSAAVDSTALTAGGLTINTDALSSAVKVGATSADLGEANDTVSIAHSADSAWAKAGAINAVSTQTEVTAIASTKVDGAAVTSGTISAGSLTINGIDIGKVEVKSSDSDGALMNAINAQTSKTGVIATNEGGKLVLNSNDGSDIKVSAATGVSAVAGLASKINRGDITLVSDHNVQMTAGASHVGFASGAKLSGETSSTLSQIDVTTRDSAEKAIRTTDSALKQLDAIRSNIGSTQNQLESTVRNISVTQVNVTAAESQIRDVDFAAESANFSKHNILAQSGAYAMSQANSVQQNVLRLLQ
ncbi:flagellin [Sulfurimonas sp.]|uniref:flagellin N-terminal helical domain-containing protein n=1 Tax=Sulfurimonas sp. TaxID=2022749 RepID=UPI00262CFB0A|nr:flagellin [Sulfurimonas sp.]